MSVFFYTSREPVIVVELVANGQNVNQDLNERNGEGHLGDGGNALGLRDNQGEDVQVPNALNGADNENDQGDAAGQNLDAALNGAGRVVGQEPLGENGQGPDGVIVVDVEGENVNEDAPEANDDDDDDVIDLEAPEEDPVIVAEYDGLLAALQRQAADGPLVPGQPLLNMVMDYHQARLLPNGDLEAWLPERGPLRRRRVVRYFWSRRQEQAIVYFALAYLRMGRDLTALGPWRDLHQASSLFRNVPDPRLIRAQMQRLCHEENRHNLEVICGLSVANGEAERNACRAVAQSLRAASLPRERLVQWGLEDYVRFRGERIQPNGRALPARQIQLPAAAAPPPAVAPPPPRQNAPVPNSRMALALMRGAQEARRNFMQQQGQAG